MLMKDIEPYLKQLDTNKESIDRLGAMENDLSFLIQALAMKTDIDTLPQELKEDIKQVKHGSSVNDEHSANLVKNQSTSTFFGAKLGSYLNEKGVKSQVNKINTLYPHVFSVLSFRLKKQVKGELTLYSLIAGPVMNVQEAEKLCVVFNQIGQPCTPDKFVGELL